MIFTDVDKATGHAMVLAGFDQKQQKYTVVNPCLFETVDFDSGADGCSAGTIQRTVNEVEGPLGKRMWYCSWILTGGSRSPPSSANGPCTDACVVI